MNTDLLHRLARIVLLLLAAAVVATSYIITEPPEGGPAPVATAHAGTAAKELSR